MTFTLIDDRGLPYESDAPGTLGGHRGNRVYGRLDCSGALRWIERGHYVSQRVFFADEATAMAAGFRPCAACMPAEHARWKARRESRLFSLVESSPVGPLLLSGDEEVLTGLAFATGARVPAGWRRDDHRFGAERRQLGEYFEGERDAFDIALRPEGASFNRRVWDELLAIPHGSTATYGEVAERVGAPGRARGRRGQRAQPDRGSDPMPPSDRRRGQAHGLWRWPAGQACAPGAGGRAPRRVRGSITQEVGAARRHRR